MYYQLTSSTTAPAGSRNSTEASEVICQIRERGREGESSQRVYTILLYCQFYLTIYSIVFYYFFGREGERERGREGDSRDELGHLLVLFQQLW